MKKMLVTTMFALTGIIGCEGGGGGGGGGGSHYSLSASDFVNKVNNRIGANELSVVKTYAVRDGWAVVYDDVYGYRAIDIQYLRNYGYSASEAADAYLAEELLEDGIDRLVSPTSNYNEFIDDYGYIYEETTMVQKDLELLQAIVDQSNVRRLGEKIAADYGLSEDAGLKVARISSEWKKLSDSRSMTDEDVDALTGDLFGVNLRDIKDAEEAYNEGDLERSNALLDQAASSLETSPENFRRIVEEMVTE